MANQRLTVSLDSSDKKISFRFTCQEDMNLTAASVFCGEAAGPPAYLVSLQEDRKGSPSGVPLTSSSYVPLARGWSTLPLDPVPLTRGKVYHLVLEQDAYRGGGHPVGLIGPSHYAAFVSTDVLNHVHPNDGSPDRAANVLFFDGRRWKELDREPVYALFGSGDEWQGNPYDDPGVRPICGGDPPDKTRQVWQGQSLHFHCGLQATSLVFRVRKQGHPTAPLNYVILKNEFQIHKTFSVHSAAALTPGQASASFQWVTVGFDDQRSTNFSPECWFLAFQTDSGKPVSTSPGCEDCYVLSDLGSSGGLAHAADLTFDGGAHQSREVYSVDGGEPFHWLDEFERDANVGVLGPPCHIVAPAEWGPLIPTPQPWGVNGGSQ